MLDPMSFQKKTERKETEKIEPTLDLSTQDVEPKKAKQAAVMSGTSGYESNGNGEPAVPSSSETLDKK